MPSCLNFLFFLLLHFFPAPVSASLLDSAVFHHPVSRFFWFMLLVSSRPPLHQSQTTGRTCDFSLHRLSLSTSSAALPRCEQEKRQLAHSSMMQKTHNKEEADAQIHCAQPASDGERDCEAQNLILSSPLLTLHVSFAHRFFTFPCSNHDLFHRAFPALVCPPRCFYFPCVAAGAAIVQLLPLPFPSPCRQQKEMRAEEMRGWRQFAIHQRFAMCCTFGFPLPLPSFSAFPTFPFGITSSQPPTAHSSSRRHPISARNNSR